MSEDRSTWRLLGSFAASFLLAACALTALRPAAPAMASLVVVHGGPEARPAFELKELAPDVGPAVPTVLERAVPAQAPAAKAVPAAAEPAPKAVPATAEPAAASAVTVLASWYGPGFDGNYTANGEIYDQEALTAAHRTLPFGTRVRVTNLTNDRRVIVRINDRGPFVSGRDIDLSHGAAQALGMEQQGIARVRLEVLGAQR